MLRCTIHNLTTDQRYAFEAADQSAVDAKLASKPCYGRAAWTETIPAWTDTTTDPPTEHPEQVIEHPAERTVTIENIDGELAQAAGEKTARAQAVQFLRNLDFDAATPAQTRTACKALWTLLKAMHKDNT